MPANRNNNRFYFFVFLAGFAFYSCLLHRPPGCEAVSFGDKNPSLLNRWLIRENGKTGFIDHSGKKIIPCIYDSAWDFSENSALVKSEGKYFYIDTNGRQLSDTKFEQAVPFYSKYTAARKDKKWGLINQQMEWVIQPQYDYLDGYDSAGKQIDNLFRDAELLAGIHNSTISTLLNLDIAYDLVPVKIKSNWVFYSVKSNHEILLPGYDDMLNWSEGLKAVKKNSKWGYVDSTGREVIACQFDEAGYFTEGISVVRQGSLYGAIDPIGKFVIPPVYPLLYECSDGVCAAMTESSLHKYIFLDKTGKVVLDKGYDNVVNFHQGRTLVKEEGKWRLIDKKGEQVMTDQFEDAYPFNNGMATVKTNGKWGIISVCGQYVVKPVSGDITYFSGGLSKVKINGKWGFADKAGHICIKPKYIYVIRDFENGVAEVLIDGKAEFNPESFSMEIKGRKGYINMEGKIIWQEQ
jgi:hypothetical protein